MLEREPGSDAAPLVNTRSMTDACPLLSSLVGMLGLFMSLKEMPWSNLSVSLVHRFGAGTLSSQLGSLMFQSPAMIIGMDWMGIWDCRWSDVHSWVIPLLVSCAFWL